MWKCSFYQRSWHKPQQQQVIKAKILQFSAANAFIISKPEVARITKAGQLWGGHSLPLVRKDGTKQATPVSKTNTVVDHRRPTFSMTTSARGKAGNSTADKRKKLRKSFFPRLVTFRVKPKYATAIADLQLQHDT